MRRYAFDLGLDALVFAVTVTHVFIAPYAKVEESFNLQATHDVVYHGWALSKYDHHQFPGVVPRTFIGAMCLALVTKPLHSLLVASHLFPPDSTFGTKIHAQITCRLVLAMTVVAALGRFRRVLSKNFGKEVGIAFAVITSTQFHLPFYASRTFPNTFALVLTTFALADWMEAHFEGNGMEQCVTKTSQLNGVEECQKNNKVDYRNYRAVFLLTLASVVFRCDVLLLLAPVGIHMLAMRSMSVTKAVLFGAKCVVGCLALTVAVDTAAWAPVDSVSENNDLVSENNQHWPGATGFFWPEGTVFWFNTYENRSGEWGVSPWYWYVLNALPRALLGAFPFAFIGAWCDARVKPIFWIPVVFVTLYSVLPHKELRFVFSALPMFNACAAVGVVYVWRRWVARTKKDGGKKDIGKKKGNTSKGTSKGRSILRDLVTTSFTVKLLFAVSFITSLLAHVLFLTAASLNYPGGVAFGNMHRNVGNFIQTDRRTKNIRVHVDVAAAMTGVSRFGESVDRGSDTEVDSDVHRDVVRIRDVDWKTRHHFVYSKAEGLDVDDFQSSLFDLLVSATKSIPGYRVVDETAGYAGVRLIKWKSVPVFVSVKSEPRIWTHVREVNKVTEDKACASKLEECSVASGDRGESDE